jgi:RAQPRD family integrative conjugative element protein
MSLFCRFSAWARLVLAVPFIAASFPSPAIAGDSPERERLAAILRQIDRIDRLAEQASRLAPEEHARYRFDYVRLREDLLRVRTSIEDYLTPRRAQPRDPLELTGDYRLPSAAEATP